MPYTPTTWAAGDVVTATRLNNIETGISNALPLAGGTMTGDLTFNQLNQALKMIDDTKRLRLIGGSSPSSANGAYINIEGKNYGGAGLGGNIYLVISGSGKVYIADGSGNHVAWHDGNLPNPAKTDAANTYSQAQTFSSTITYQGDNLPRLRNNSGVIQWYDGSTWKAVGGVKSVQRGTTSFTANPNTYIDVTLATAVDMTKTFVIITVAGSGVTTQNTSDMVSRQLTSSTNLRFSVGATTNNTKTISWEVVENY